MGWMNVGHTRKPEADKLLRMLQLDVVNDETVGALPVGTEILVVRANQMMAETSQGILDQEFLDHLAESDHEHFEDALLFAYMLPEDYVPNSIEEVTTGSFARTGRTHGAEGIPPWSPTMLTARFPEADEEAYGAYMRGYKAGKAARG